MGSLCSLSLAGCRQLTDLSPLAGLTGLQQLNLSECEQLTDLSPLAGLTGLQHLDFHDTFNRINDLGPLAGLTGLQDLELGVWYQRTGPGPLAGFTGLRRLELIAIDGLTDLSPLAGLAGLQHLDLSGCHLPTDLKPLMGLTGLRHLALNPSDGLTDLSPLAGLTGLQHLELDPSDGLTDLSPLAGLTGLQTLGLRKCRRLTDLSPLAGLTGLQYLDLSWCRRLTDLSPLAGLTGLQHLDLSGCEQLTISDSIKKLALLEHLACAGVAFPCIPLGSPINSLPRLQSLRATVLKGAPQEMALAEDALSGSCLDEILAWQSDLLASGEAPNTELKVFVLGNGGVGKTQICRRLQGQPFDPEVSSTHGVSLGRVPLLTGEDGKTSLFANLWDFGGQDVYLGTHSLFLDERAVYLIVWTPGHENDRSVEEHGIPMQNRPLGYWLEYVRSLAGHEAPIIVIQAQCDSESAVSEAPIPTGHGFRRLQRTACSSLRNDGMERLWPALRAAGRLLQERHESVRLPRSWVAVAERLREIRNDGKKAISWDQYLEICRNACSGALPDASIQYLHRSG